VEFSNKLIWNGKTKFLLKSFWLYILKGSRRIPERPPKLVGFTLIQGGVSGTLPNPLNQEENSSKEKKIFLMILQGVNYYKN
jgi:hypothetical protein